MRSLKGLTAEGPRSGPGSRAESLFESLEEVSREEHERAWAEEAAARHAEFEHRQLIAVDSESVLHGFEVRSRS
jgi:hypothetical protein